MQKLDLNDVSAFVEENIGLFHQQRLSGIEKLKLSDVLKKKNPYLFRAKNILTAEGIITSLLSARLSSNEETIFGDWLEGLAIFVNQKVHNGWKSGIPGIDLEFDFDEKRYIVSIKSGPNWGNSSQIKEMRTRFKSAKQTLRTGNSKLTVVAVNGCCYGKESNPDKGDYHKYCGQEFWEFISGNRELFVEIVEPLGYKAKEKNDQFLQEYARKVNQFTKEFVNDFCDHNGEIDWERLVRFNSAQQTKA